MSDKVQVNGGIGLAGLLTVVFVIFKLLGKLDWSWWWVFSPIWISWGIVLAILFVVGILALLLAVLSS